MLNRYDIIFLPAETPDMDKQYIRADKNLMISYASILKMIKKYSMNQYDWLETAREGALTVAK